MLVSVARNKTNRQELVIHSTAPIINAGVAWRLRNYIVFAGCTVFSQVNSYSLSR